jgi:hypothetical protein
MAERRQLPQWSKNSGHNKYDVRARTSSFGEKVNCAEHVRRVGKREDLLYKERAMTHVCVFLYGKKERRRTRNEE